MIEKATPSLTSYYSAIFKKQPVTITLDSDSFCIKSDKNKDVIPDTNNSDSGSKGSGNGGDVSIPWRQIQKHQVSPASHPKCLLKLILKQSPQQNNGEEAGAVTFTFETRAELEAIRRDITQRLMLINQDRDAAGEDESGSKKRKAEDPYTSKTAHRNSFTDISPEMLAVTRATLLANDASLNAQHKLLVKETATLTEEDFWSAHFDQLSEECARIHGKYRKGISTSMMSNLQLQGVVRLGVEEIRQIFVLYPAVHKAYVEKVPLELSEEQFWKKYLESEYFYRDRGRLGQMARMQRIEQQLQQQPKQGKTLSSTAQGGEEDAEKKRRQYEQQELENSSVPATAAVVSGVDDIFSRYDAELRQQQQQQQHRKQLIRSDDLSKNPRDPRMLAIGQFDLASTVNTERSHLGEGDLHPDTSSSGNLGSLIVQKYNRHWAMVLNPDEHHAAVGGTDYLTRTAARHSFNHVLPNDDTPKPNGGNDVEMRRLVAFANCDELVADHVNGLGDEEFQELCLNNLAGYYSSSDPAIAATPSSSAALKDLRQRNFLLSKQVADDIKLLTTKSFGLIFPLEGSKSKAWLPPSDSGANSKEGFLPSTVLPVPEIGLPLLKALSKRMGDSLKSDADALKIADSLSQKFKIQLDSCFRRSSELLRHFFGLRRVIEISKESDKEKEKLGKIFNGMEALYKEIEKIRLDLPQNPQGEMMRRMCKPIMDQLDLAFKLHYRGGFVSVGSSNFVSVSLG